MRLSNWIGKGFAVVVFTLALTAAGFGVWAHAQDGPPMGPGPGFENNSTGFEGAGTEGFQPANRPQRRRPPHIGGLLGRTLHDNLAAETLAELTMQDVSVIQEEMIGADLRDLLLSYEVSLKDFKAGMDLRSEDLLDRAAGCGLITDEEADSILEMIQNPPEPPESTEGERPEGGRPPRPNGPPTDTETM